MKTGSKVKPSIYDVLRAQQALSGVIHRTPLDHSTTFSRRVSSKIYLKLENLQKTGSFKVRGAHFKIASRTDSHDVYCVFGNVSIKVLSDRSGVL